MVLIYTTTTATTITTTFTNTVATATTSTTAAITAISASTTTATTSTTSTTHATTGTTILFFINVYIRKNPQFLTGWDWSQIDLHTRCVLAPLDRWLMY